MRIGHDPGLVGLWYLLASQEDPSNPFSQSVPAAAELPVTGHQTSRSFEMDDVLRQAEALLRFSGEVENRMVESGLGGVNGVIERYIQLRQALDRLSQRELDWAKGEVDRLIATLTGVAEQLEQLRAIKLAIVDQR
ncbi:MAG: hypothetical protein FJ148_21860 [Deltaproteobacteria bacterium]|nr:hypothetical protein [Deltaproteobacteria bacterium]